MSKSVKDVLLELGYSKIQKSADEYRVSVLDERGNHLAAFAINENTGRYYDHVSCSGGSLEKFVKLHDKDIDLTGLNISEVQEKIERPTIFKKESLDLLFPIYDYWLKRGISIETQKLFKMGLCHSGRLYRRICVPIINPDGRIYGFSGRIIKDDPEASKWKHIGGKKFWLFPALYNHNICAAKREIILLESIGDMLSLWEAGVRNTLVLFGLTMSSKQISYLLGLNPERIYISTNNDTTGRGQQAAVKLEAKLKKLFDSGKIKIKFPSGKDWGAMTKLQIQKEWALT